jgi:hypothetical protein
MCYLTFNYLRKNLLSIPLSDVIKLQYWPNAPCCLVCGCEDPTTAVVDRLQIIARHIAVAAAQLREVVAVRVHSFLAQQQPRLWIYSTVLTQLFISVADPACLSRIPDPDFCPYRIPDPKTATKRRVERKFVVLLFS